MYSCVFNIVIFRFLAGDISLIAVMLKKKTKTKKKHTAPSCFSVERELLAFRASHWTTESNGIVSVTFCHFLWRQAWQLLIYNIISTRGHLIILDFRLLFVAFTYGSYSRFYSWWSPCWILLLSCKLVTPFSGGKRHKFERLQRISQPHRSFRLFMAHFSNLSERMKIAKEVHGSISDPPPLPQGVFRQHGNRSIYF